MFDAVKSVFVNAFDRMFEYVTAPLHAMKISVDRSGSKASRKAGKDVRFQSTSFNIGRLTVDGRELGLTPRFLRTFNMRFSKYGLCTSSLYTLFSPNEVAERLARVEPDAALTFVIDHGLSDKTQADGKPPRLLGLTRWNDLRADQLEEVLLAGNPHALAYSDGTVRADFIPKLRDDIVLAIGGNPDIYGREFTFAADLDSLRVYRTYLKMVRQVCTNGIVAMHSAFQGVVSPGREGSPANAIQRAISSFEADTEFLELAERIEMAHQSFASLAEFNQAYQALARNTFGCNLFSGSTPAQRLEALAAPTFRFLHMRGDDGESVGKAAGLPTSLTVGEIINFLTEVRSHGGLDAGLQMRLDYTIGNLLCRRFDLEGTASRVNDFRDLYSLPEDRARIREEGVNRAVVPVQEGSTGVYHLEIPADLPQSGLVSFRDLTQVGNTASPPSALVQDDAPRLSSEEQAELDRLVEESRRRQEQEPRWEEYRGDGV